MTRLVDITGDRFGSWVVVGRAPPRGGQTNARWVCRCDCGSVRDVLSTVLRRGESQSCGHSIRESRRATAIRHGHAMVGVSPTYVSWAGMKARCNNPSNPAYRNYGGRGITVCDSWLQFSSFLVDMGERPEGATLDRIDNNDGYRPGNCRWATPTQQANNRRPRSKHKEA